MINNINDKSMIDERLNQSKERLIKNIDMLNKSVQKDSKELDKNKLIVMLICKYGINPFKNISVKDVAQDLGMNQNSANDLFRRSDFPALTFTKPKQICWLTYLLWKTERRL